LNQLHRLTALGFPTLLGTSRKSFLGKLTGKTVDQRLFGSLATVSLAVAAGVDVVRVHDVAQTRDALAVSDAIVRQIRPSGWRADV
jgi:dihydropteroate synthase